VSEVPVATVFTGPTVVKVPIAVVFMGLTVVKVPVAVVFMGLTHLARALFNVPASAPSGAGRDTGTFGKITGCQRAGIAA
jgi:hypothetical protein